MPTTTQPSATNSAHDSDMGVERMACRDKCLVTTLDLELWKCFFYATAGLFRLFLNKKISWQ